MVNGAWEKFKRDTVMSCGEECTGKKTWKKTETAVGEYGNYAASAKKKRYLTILKKHYTEENR
jgi:hypothetical protein